VEFGGDRVDVHAEGVQVVPGTDPVAEHGAEADAFVAGADAEELCDLVDTAAAGASDEVGGGEGGGC
jgi:hypothetical protein